MTIIGLVGCFILGVLVIASNPRRVVNWLSGVIKLSLFVWSLVTLLFIYNSSTELAFLYSKVISIALAGVAVLTFLFSFIFPTGKTIPKSIVAIALLSFSLLSGLIMFWPGFFVSNEIISARGNSYVVNSVSYLIFLIYFIVFLFPAIATIAYKFIKVKNKELKLQSGSYLLGIFALVVPGAYGNLWLPYFADCHLLWVGQVALAFFVIFVGYGIFRHGLFDVRLAAVRTVAYSMSLVALAAFFLAIAAAMNGIFESSHLKVDQVVISAVIGVLLLIIFQPVKKLFDYITNRIFYRSYYDSDKFFARLNRLHVSITDLRSLLERTALEISSTVKSTQAFFFVYMRDGHYITAGTNHHMQLSSDQANALNELYGNKKEMIIASRLDDDDPIRLLMKSHKIEIIVPLAQTEIVGFLCLGEKLTSTYTGRDMQVLSTATDGLIIAIQNALSIQEIKRINAENLKQRVADATKELRANNELLKKLDEQKDEFVSVASHELRTPMTVVSGFINLLQREKVGPINDRQREILDRISNNTKTLIDLVNDMLDLSKLESNKLVISLASHSLDNLIKDSIDKIQLLYTNKKVNLEYKGDNIMVMTDAAKFERVMLNLLSNANKFTNTDGRVTVTSKVDQDKKYAVVCVADTGIGISEDAKGMLFKKFSQVDDYLQRRTGGTGLGLAISKQLVEKMGGRIWANSTVGVGSKFYFTLPLADSKKSDH
ncbi:MAG: ATP-binding protein [Candidatus Saccharimonadales bacterium]